jgi:hypothetical protein
METKMGLLLVEGRRREGGGRTAGRTRCVCACVERNSRGRERAKEGYSSFLPTDDGAQA